MPGLQWLRWWATLLDSRFRVPGTNIRFGLDPLLSLVPGLGDLASPAFAHTEFPFRADPHVHETGTQGV